MDPDATLALILEHLGSLQSGDEDAREELIEALRSLASWLETGGFPPRRAFVLAD